MQKAPMTAEGFSNLEDELRRLKSEERPSIRKALEEAAYILDDVVFVVLLGESEVILIVEVVFGANDVVDVVEVHGKTQEFIKAGFFAGDMEDSPLGEIG